jgi:amidophosphoribosyltransferase
MLREAGAAEVHVRISSPPVKWPCFYGIDFATRAELIANGLAVDEIRQSVGADSLAYISLDELVEATTIPRDRLCTACFTGEYPVALPEPEELGKHLLEGYERGSTSADVVADAPLAVATGASDALGRP